MSDLDYLRARADVFGVRPLADEVLGCPHFRTWPASATPGRHHGREGGLLRHTREVAELALATLEVLGAEYAEKRLVFLAALFHDFAKTRTYVRAEGGGWAKGPEDKAVGHVVGSAMMWDLLARESHFPDDERMRVLHLILAHHGRKEWGSPVEPADRLAWALHLADMASARWADGGEGKK